MKIELDILELEELQKAIDCRYNKLEKRLKEVEKNSIPELEIMGAMEVLHNTHNKVVEARHKILEEAEERKAQQQEGKSDDI